MRYLNLHTHESTGDPGVLEIVNQYPWEFNAAVAHYSIGIHPWHIREERLESDLKTIESYIQRENCLAVGECGLDKRIDFPFDKQAEVFESQLVLAQQYGKPVIIHCVAAFQELIETKKRLKIAVPMIIHGFSKNIEAAKQLLNQGFYLSFGKYLLRNPDLEAVFRAVPNDRFFLETDTIEAGIRDVYALAANYRDCTIETLQDRLNANFEFIFKPSIPANLKSKIKNQHGSMD